MIGHYYFVKIQAYIAQKELPNAVLMNAIRRNK
jgi:hypothetical protein